MAAGTRKISFPPDSVLNAVIQDADICELLKILRTQRDEVNINQKNHVGLTALHHAVLTNNLDIVKILLSYGSDVNAQDNDGFTPLHTASAYGYIQVSSLLVIFGADVFIMNRHFEYPIDVAKDLNVVRLLSNEMCCRLHSEFYVHSLFLSKIFHLWSVVLKWIHIFCCAVMCIYNFFIPSKGERLHVNSHVPAKSKSHSKPHMKSRRNSANDSIIGNIVQNEDLVFSEKKDKYD